MTNEEAIEILQEEAQFLYGDDSPYDRQAFDLAIAALECAGIWIDGDIIGTDFLTHNGTKYEIHFRKDDLEKYEAVQTACRLAIGQGKPLPEPPKEET